MLAALILATCTLAAAGGTASRALQTNDPSARAVAASAYSIIDVASKRTLDEQRGDWLDAPVWPGSIAKLATYTAAIDAGTLSDSTRILCTRRVTLRDGRRVDCSHPPIASALSLREAVAMSCNVFAAEIARSLTASQLAAGFARLGLPMPPSSGDRDRVAIALGLGGTRVPPRKLLHALIRVMSLPDAGPRERAQALLREGLRDSARSGTAAAFGRAGIDAFAKTGTALMPNGRPLGLVVALAPASAPGVAIVVALPGGAGADAADVAATLLRRRRVGTIDEANSAAQTGAAQTGAAQTGAASSGGASIRVGTPTANGYRVETVPLEEYVARVVAGETSSATPAAARDALAITARTYALANRGRHASDGFDLCTLTHCQVLRPTSSASRDAAARTRGRTLTREAMAQTPAPAPVTVFYSAACGGTLEDASTLLPDTRPGAIAWMTNRPDPAGVDEPVWHAELSAADLMNALRASGVRGEVLRDLGVRTNGSGRVTAITLAGLTPATLDADDFRRIIGQRLGWQWLKSPRFTVRRTARGYRFDGRGHGHGVGLCLLGASAFATRGKSAEDILQIYFPGLRVVSAPALPQAVIDLRLPASEERERASLRSQVEQDLRDLTSALALDASTPATRRVSLIVHPTVDSFRRVTGRPWWTSAATTFDTPHAAATIHLVPLANLRRTGRLDATIRHELVHALTDTQLRSRPLWVREGIAAHYAGERVAAVEAAAASCPSDAEFTRARSADAFQQAYARAAACVARELARGVSWRAIGAMGESR